MTPINDCLVLKTLKDKYESDSGLELYTENNGIRYNYGEVIASSDNNTVKAGDKVYYDSVAGSKLLYNGDKLLVLRERDIAIIDD